MAAPLEDSVLERIQRRSKVAVMKTSILGFVLLMVLSATAFAQVPGIDSATITSVSGRTPLTMKRINRRR